MPTMPTQSIQCDPQHLAAAVVAHLSVGQPHQSQSQLQSQSQAEADADAQARILDRGAYASIYLVSTTLPGAPKSFVVRVSTRPVYNPTARRQEKDKIRGYVGILLLIHGMFPVQPHPSSIFLPFFTKPLADSSSEQPALPLPSARSHPASSHMTHLRRANSVTGGSR